LKKSESMQLAKRSAKNTLGCLIGCAIGDLGAIFCFQSYYSPGGIPMELWNMVWGTAMCCGIITSIILETLILWKQLGPKEAFRTAIGMSLISMILMEVAMNLADYGMMGEPAITLAVLPVTLGAGFFAAWPYNFWRLKKHGKCCH
tara:strand:+ start:177 stop:614 length:438 start_codon:yes stop_codon:yes gene_type:complete